MRRRTKALTAEPAEPLPDWTGDFDPSLPVEVHQALGVRRAELEARLVAEGATARVLAAQRKLDADYATELRRMRDEAAERSKPKATAVAKPAEPYRPSPSRRRGATHALVVKPVQVMVIVFVLMVLLVGPGPVMTGAKFLGYGVGAAVGGLNHVWDEAAEGKRLVEREHIEPDQQPR